MAYYKSKVEEKPRGRIPSPKSRFHRFRSVVTSKSFFFLLLAVIALFFAFSQIPELNEIRRSERKLERESIALQKDQRELQERRTEFEKRNAAYPTRLDEYKNRSSKYQRMEDRYYNTRDALVKDVLARGVLITGAAVLQRYLGGSKDEVIGDVLENAIDQIGDQSLKSKFNEWWQLWDDLEKEEAFLTSEKSKLEKEEAYLKNEKNKIEKETSRLQKEEIEIERRAKKLTEQKKAVTSQRNVALFFAALAFCLAFIVRRNRV